MNPSQHHTKSLLYALLLILFSGCLSTGGESGDLSEGAVTPETHSLFPITASTAHGETTCNDCHGNYDTFSQFSCVDCHEHAETETTANHAAVSGYAYDSNACYSCHPDGTSAGIDHEPFFPISTGTIHNGLACATCHIDPNDRKVLGCITCHFTSVDIPAHDDQAGTDAKHTGVTGYSYDSTSCYGCHPNGTGDAGSSVNHAEVFPIGSGTVHSTEGCSDCHIDVTNRANVSCRGTNCHPSATMSTKHSMVGDYVWANADCLDCHPNSDVTHVTTHLPFLISLTPQNKHYKSACRTCHNSSIATKPFEATDFNVYSCVPCHNFDHTRQYNNVATTCTRSGCHPDGRKIGN